MSIDKKTASIEKKKKHTHTHTHFWKTQQIFTETPQSIEFYK